MSAEQPQKTFPVSWEQLHRDAKALAWRLVAEGPWQGLAAITRGGLVPAAVVARELDLRLIDTLCIASYDDRAQGELRVMKDVPGDGEGWLIKVRLAEPAELDDALSAADYRDHIAGGA